MKKRRFLAMLLSLVLCLGVTAVPAFAEEGSKEIDEIAVEKEEIAIEGEELDAASYTTLTLNSNPAQVTVTTSNRNAFYEFTPQETCRYRFTSHSTDSDPCIYIFDEYGDVNSNDTAMASHDDKSYGVRAYNFRLVVELQAGRKYIIKLYDFAKSTATWPMTIAKIADTSRYIRVAAADGGTRYTTAIAAADEMKRYMGYEKFDTIVLANAENYPDALSGGPLAAMLEAPILLVGKNSTIALNYIKSNLQVGGQVYLLGGTLAVSDSVETQLKNQGYQVKRLSGANRYGTNLAIVREMVSLGRLARGYDIDDNENYRLEDAVLVQGDGYADSLSISGAASVRSMPILLIPKSGPTQAQLDYIDKCIWETVYIIGGTAAVSAQTEELLVARYGKDGVIRVAGSNRFTTSIEIAKQFSTDQEQAVVLAYGMNFPDGLTGGPLAGVTGSMVLLVTDKARGAACSYVHVNAPRVAWAYTMGGKLVISDETVDYIIDNGVKG